MMTWLNRIYYATLGRRSAFYHDRSEEMRQDIEER